MQESNKAKIAIFILGFLLVVMAGLSGWALYAYHQEATTVQQQVDEAVASAVAEAKDQAAADFEEQSKLPFRSYTTPEVYGDIEVHFPKNWSLYVEDDTSSRTQVDLTIHPELVRVQRGEQSPRAFRLQLEDNLYEEGTRRLRRDVDRGDLRATATRVSGIDGVRYEGQITREHEGVLVALPLRDKTLLIWTEGGRYRSDFDEILDQIQISR